MHCRFLFVLTLMLWSAGGLLLPRTATAEVPLTRAVVQNLRNQVRLLLKNQAPRPAQRLDAMTPGDALATARAALAEMRFNDGSTTRVGEQTLFRFQPNSRSFRLDNGTLLLIIPPGRGETRIRTPNAAAGIRGSALFVRYNPDTDTTLVGALTNSQIEVSNQDKSQSQVLKAGQMAVITQNRIDRVYDFDLNTFYETSELVKGLDLPRRSATAHSDPAIAAVQLETAEAIRAQAPLIGQGVVDNPAFVRLASGAANLPAPALLSDLDRTMFTGISPFTSVASELRRLGSGKQNPPETGTQVVVSAPSTLSPSVSVTSSTLPIAAIVGSPAPLPSPPNPPEVPAIPTSGLPIAPTPTNPAPPSPAPAPLPPATAIVQPPASTPPATTVIVVQPPAPAPAPLPPTPAVTVVQPPTAAPPTAVVVVQPPAPLPPATVVVQPPAPAPLPPTTAVIVVQPPAPAPAPLPPTPAIIVQPPAPAPLPAVVIQPPAPAPAPLPSIPAIVQPPATSIVSPPTSPIEVAPVQASPAPAVPSFPASPTAAPALTPAAPAASAIVTATPPVNSVPITPPGTDNPPIVPTANPVVQSAPAATAGGVLEISPASAKVTPLPIK